MAYFLYCSKLFIFEKERAVLETLPQEDSFAITITRFAQLARYFTSNQPNQKKV